MLRTASATPGGGRRRIAEATWIQSWAALRDGSEKSGHGASQPFSSMHSDMSAGNHGQEVYSVFQQDVPFAAQERSGKVPPLELPTEPATFQN
jgi:hypothetical protein